MRSVTKIDLSGSPLRTKDMNLPDDLLAAPVPRGSAEPSHPRTSVVASSLVATLFGLGAAEMLSSLSRKTQSPVLDVGDRAVDLAPAWVKELAISLFGTNDKIALLVGIAVVLGGYAVAVGFVFVRSRWLAAGGVAAFGAVGAAAAITGRNPGPLWAVLPSLGGAVLTFGALNLLLRSQVPQLGRVGGPASASIAASVPSPRRRFLASVAGFGAAAAVLGFGGRKNRERFSAASSRTATGVPVAASPLSPIPASTTFDVEGISAFFTPNDEFYRIDTALTVPQLPIDSWTLRITGMVDRPVELTFEDLLARPIVESDITLTCVSNEIGGGLMGTARWLGVRLDDLLADVGVMAAADQIVGKSSDGFTAGFPVEVLDGRDALIAVAMNGESLPLQHGFPARLIVPGLYGYVSATKWLTEINLTRFEDFDGYWVPRGWDALGPIKTQSRIDTPRGLSTLSPGTIAIAGVAWAQTRGIDRVEVQIDDGEWLEAELAAELNDVTWRQWKFAWDATPGRHTVTVRATDRNGDVQTADRATPMPNGATGQHQIVVLVADQ